MVRDESYRGRVSSKIRYSSHAGASLSPGPSPPARLPSLWQSRSSSSRPLRSPRPPGGRRSGYSSGAPCDLPAISSGRRPRRPSPTSPPAWERPPVKSRQEKQTWKRCESLSEGAAREDAAQLKVCINFYVRIVRVRVLMEYIQAVIAVNVIGQREVEAFFDKRTGDERTHRKSFTPMYVTNIAVRCHLYTSSMEGREGGVVYMNRMLQFLAPFIEETTTKRPATR